MRKDTEEGPREGGHGRAEGSGGGNHQPRSAWSPGAGRGGSKDHPEGWRDQLLEGRSGKGTCHTQGPGARTPALGRGSGEGGPLYHSESPPGSHPSGYFGLLEKSCSTAPASSPLSFWGPGDGGGCGGPCGVEAVAEAWEASEEELVWSGETPG